MPAKRTKKTARKISDINPPKASASSRPIIVNNPAAPDPMMTSPIDPDEAPSLSTHGRTIEPPSHDDKESSSPADESLAGPSPDEIIEKAKARQTDIDDKTGAKPIDVPTSPEPTTDPSSETIGDPSSEGSGTIAKSEPATEDSPEPKEKITTVKEDDIATKAAAEKAEAEQAAKYDEMVASQKYFVPINAARKRHDRYWLLALGLIIIVIIIVDLLFDSGTLKISGFNFHTNFFHH